MGLGTEGVGLPGRIGGYTLERELGAGGMGTVYLARSRGGRTVAVKVARSELAADPHFRARFRAEVEAARRVGGFHTAPVVDADPDAETPWLATAYIPGPTLSGLLRERGPMGEQQLRLLGAALAEALQAIHACGLIHRDLKPGNIIMADDGPRVLDFGIARALESTRLTSTGMAFGTPGFLAPEQAQGGEVGVAADVFALGAVLVAAAGGSAFGEGTPMALMYRSVHEEADLSALPTGLRPVVAACLAKEPGRRPTPEGLLDLFVPEAGTPVAGDPEPGPGPEPYTPTLGAEAAEAAGAAGAADAVPAAAGGVEGALTVTAPVGRPTPTTTPAPVERTRVGLLAGVAGALLLIGGAAYATYVSREPETPFPEATHRLTIASPLAGDSYRQKDETPLLDQLKDDATQKDATYISVHYSSTGKVNTYGDVHVSGRYGRLKDPAGHRDRMISSLFEAGDEGPPVIDPRKAVRVPGSDVEFTCEATTNETWCAWADDNTVAVVTFDRNIAPELPLAAAETRRIRDDMRQPIS
ncbi:serine/threonine-protein kinase [Streptomyces sp. NPDC058667]|uniref:serine/threonine-protein kinase n=1 Tax=Streptomyces sp. NPDC058667 TaxID=3346588 RepID=UPI003648035B